MESDEEMPAAPQTPARSEVTDIETSSQIHGIDTLDQLHRAEINRSRRRVATVYDAVAGRLSHHKGASYANEEAKTRPVTKSSLHETKYGPEEVLFRRKDAPQRYAEHDVYFANERDLPHGGRGVLPESELLKAVHGYAGQFYGRMQRRGNIALQSHNLDEESMDETALLAFGILLEEAGRDVLGKRGDMVFTEGMEPEGSSTSPRRRNEQVLVDAVGPLEGMTAGSQVRVPKRRKVAKTPVTP